MRLSARENQKCALSATTHFVVMTESTDNPSLFAEDQLPKQPARAKRTTTKAKTAVAAKAPAAPRKPRASKATASASESAPAAPAKAPAPVRKKAVRKTASKADVIPAAEMPAPPAPVATPAVVVSEPVAVESISIPTAAVQAEAAPKAKAPARRPAARGKTPVPAIIPRPPTRVQDIGAEEEEWRPGSGTRAAQVAPEEPVTSIPVDPPAAVVVPPAVPPREPSAPATPAITDPPQPGNVSVAPKSWENQTREERIAAARMQFEAGKAPAVTEVPRQNFPPRERREFGGRERREFQPRERREFGGGRPDRNRGEPQERGYREFPVRNREEPTPAEPPVPEGPQPDPVYSEGIVEVSGKGFGFLRDPKRNFAQHPSDVFVTPEACRRYSLRDGMWIRGEIRRGNRGPQLHKLTEIEGEDPEKFRTIPMFEEVTTINPNKWVKLETVPDRYTTRVIDMMAPIGRGQRGIIVAPPRTGKTTLLEHIADAIGKNHPDMKLIILLVDERPEEVTEIRRTVPFAEIMASSNDQEIKSHTRIAQLAIERAKRLVEMGKDVFILLDSITRVGRAFNNAMAGGGRTMSGGVDARALEIPRKLFAAARNTEEAGSLTIIATALIETGSRMDELIFQEFKGTGNMELVLDRKISDLRVYPAIDIFQSGTRREELLLPEADLHKINIIRRGLSGHKPVEAIERLLSFLQKFPTNAQMLREIPG